MLFWWETFWYIFFSNNTNKLRFLSVVLNWMWYVCQIGRFKGDLSVSDHYLSCTTYIYSQDNDSLIGQQWIVVTYLYWYTLIIIFILFINCILMLLLYIYTMPCLLRFFKYFIFTVIGSSILQPLNVVGARNSKTSQTL